MARIVIADDDADIRELVVFKLRHAGHEVLPVADGAAAVEACLSSNARPGHPRRDDARHERPRRCPRAARWTDTWPASRSSC